MNKRKFIFLENKMTTENIFVRSYKKFLSGENKMSLIEPEEMCSNFTIQPEELELFFKLGETDINKTEKSKEEIEKDEDVVIGTHITETDPRRLLKTE